MDDYLPAIRAARTWKAHESILQRAWDGNEQKEIAKAYQIVLARNPSALGIAGLAKARGQWARLHDVGIEPVPVPGELEQFTRRLLETKQGRSHPTAVYERYWIAIKPIPPTGRGKVTGYATLTAKDGKVQKLPIYSDEESEAKQAREIKEIVEDARALLPHPEAAYIFASGSNKGRRRADAVAAVVQRNLDAFGPGGAYAVSFLYEGFDRGERTLWLNRARSMWNAMPDGPGKRRLARFHPPLAQTRP